MKTKSNKKAPLRCKLIGDKVVIDVGIDTIAFVFENGDNNNPFNEKADDYVRQYTVVDKKQFAKDVIDAMLLEEEDGSSMLTKLFDDATEAAVESGSNGIKDE